MKASVRPQSRSPGSSSAALHRMLARYYWPNPVSISLVGLGKVTIQLTSLHICDGDSGPSLQAAVGSCQFIPLGLQGKGGVLCVDTRLAMGLVAALLGRSVPTVLAGNLSRVERGMLEGVVLAFLASLGVDRGICLWADEDKGEQEFQVGAVFEVELSGCCGPAWLLLTGPLFQEIQGAHASFFEHWREIVVPRVEVARTGLQKSGLAKAREGDVLVFDGTNALALQDAWPVHLCLGAMRIPATLGVDGTVHLQDVAVEESQVLLSEIPGQSDTGNMDLVCAPRTRGPVHANASARLSDTVVDVTAEIGRLSLRGSGLAAAFRKGELQPEVDASRDVQLWVEGAPWFVGEVVDVDGDLGVRLKSKRAG